MNYKSQLWSRPRWLNFITSKLHLIHFVPVGFVSLKRCEKKRLEPARLCLRKLNYMMCSYRCVTLTVTESASKDISSRGNLMNGWKMWIESEVLKNDLKNEQKKKACFVFQLMLWQKKVSKLSPWQPKTPCDFYTPSVVQSPLVKRNLHGRLFKSHKYIAVLTYSLLWLAVSQPVWEADSPHSL